jgi:hypothetical protein
MVELFDSENLSVRLFGYKLVRMVGRVDLVEKIGLIANTAADEEKVEILKTIDSLGVPGYTNLINLSMRSTNPKLATQAIKVAGSLGDKSSEEVILELLKSGSSFQIKMALMEGLKNLNLESFENLVVISQDPEEKEICNHLTDTLLSHV